MPTGTRQVTTRREQRAMLDEHLVSSDKVLTHASGAVDGRSVDGRL